MYGDCGPEHIAGYDLMSSCSSRNSEMSMGEILELLCILHKMCTHTHTQHTLYLTVVLYVHRFTNKNIIHKTPEWTLIAVVLLHL